MYCVVERIPFTSLKAGDEEKAWLDNSIVDHRHRATRHNSYCCLGIGIPSCFGARKRV